MTINRIPVTLYQVNTQDPEAFRESILGKFLPIEKMEPVCVVRMGGSDEQICDKAWELFNRDTLNFSLNYSMSVGDVLDIMGRKYRCTPTGWDRI